MTILSGTKYRAGVGIVGCLFIMIIMLSCSSTIVNDSSRIVVSSGDGEVRAVWASTLSPCMNSPEEIRELVASVRTAHLNTIIAQVRHRGSVYYKSDIEPRAPSIKDIPDFDPLAVLLEEAHDTSGGKARIDVYAWFNVFPVRDQEALRDAQPAPLSINHPEWLSLDREGKPQPLLEPALPEGQDYLISVIEECLKNYDVDGVNLDYVRYLDGDVGYHPKALERFNRLTGRTTSDLPDPDDESWNAFRRDQITNFVRRCAVSVWTIRPDALFSVCAIGYGPPSNKGFSETGPFRQVHQDWAGWIEKGYVDVVTRMGYKREHVPEHAQQFRDWADFSRALQDRCPGRFVTLGIGGYFNKQAGTLNQYREAQKRKLGTSLFSYHRPIDESEDKKEFGPESPFWAVLGKEIYTTHANPPRPQWRKTTGVLAGFLKDTQGKILDGATISLAGTSFRTTTDGSGFFMFSNLKPGTYRVEAPCTHLDEPSITIAAGSMTFLR